jgi:hypothetical protein
MGEMLPVTMGDSSPMFKDKRKRIKLEKKNLEKLGVSTDFLIKAKHLGHF